ncbi:MAG: PAS domain-containing protein [Candidatus Margulisbacteria bacterium]|nr:PAS domain-containing protein [Candidatus Margulisiibacteriota bacterium]
MTLQFLKKMATLLLPIKKFNFNFEYTVHRFLVFQSLIFIVSIVPMAFIVFQNNGYIALLLTFTMAYIISVTISSFIIRHIKVGQNRFLLAVNGANDGIWDWDIQNQTVFISARFLELLGRPFEEAVIKPQEFFSFFYPADKFLINKFLKHHLIENSIFDCECRLKKKSGKLEWFNVRGQAIWDENNKALRMAGSIRDISNIKKAENQIMKKHSTMKKEILERKMAEKSLVESKKLLEIQKSELQKVNHELDNFVYTASHDLRAPLRGIMNYAQFLKEDHSTQIDKEGHQFIQKIQNNSSKMTALIEDLLSLSKMAKINNPFEQVNISDLVKDVLDRLSFDLSTHHVELKIQPSLPSIVCDRIKVTEVFANLISNAIKFSSKQNDTPVVQVKYESTPEFSVFSITDNGIGIDPQNHNDIFQLFTRVQTQEKFQGTGAGLCIVKKIIDAHEGEVWVESEMGKGATFKFTIPKNLIASTAQTA